MEKFEVFFDKIEEEIEDAESYAHLALDCRDEDPVSAELFYKLANEEIGHANLLHTRIVGLIEAYKKEHGEPPEPMLMVYKILHKKYVENAAAAKGMLGVYKS